MSEKQSVLTWFDFAVTDERASMNFYKNLFDWEFQPYGSNYWVIKTNGKGIGAIRKDDTFTPVQGFTPYFSIISISSGIKKILDNNGTLIGDTTSIGAEGFFQNFHDLDGNLIALWSMVK